MEGEGGKPVLRGRMAQPSSGTDLPSPLRPVPSPPPEHSEQPAQRRATTQRPLGGGSAARIWSIIRKIES